MPRTFGEELLHFAQSVDIIDTDACDKVRKLVADYFNKVLKLDFWEVQTDHRLVEGRRGLETRKTKDDYWTNGKPNPTVVRTDSGGYRDQTTWAYDTRNILWVVEENGGLLHEKSKCVNRWPQNKRDEKMPPYWPFVGDMKTQIVFPLQHGEHVFGMMDLEAKEFHDYSKSAGDELQRISTAVAIILWLHDTYMQGHSGTYQALENVIRLFDTNRISSPLEKPKIFLASSSRADDQVVGIIRQMIAEFRVDEEFWKNITQPGNVNEQVLTAIQKCDLGICYFSEPVGTSQLDYVDNFNVIFEAGMLDALAHQSPASRPQWIPVREERSPKAPFDFASKRAIIVSRLPSGALNEDAFRRDLREHLKSALKV
jgi:hypothetical protein